MATGEFTKQEARECMQILDREIYEPLPAGERRRIFEAYLRLSAFLSVAEFWAPCEARPDASQRIPQEPKVE